MKPLRTTVRALVFAMVSATVGGGCAGDTGQNIGNAAEVGVAGTILVGALVVDVAAGGHPFMPEGHAPPPPDLPGSEGASDDPTACTCCVLASDPDVAHSACCVVERDAQCPVHADPAADADAGSSASAPNP